MGRLVGLGKEKPCRCQRIGMPAGVSHGSTLAAAWKRQPLWSRWGCDGCRGSTTTIKTWALPPLMMPAMADTATGLQTSGRRTTKARMGSVLAQACLHLGAVSPLADRHVWACLLWASWSLMRQLWLKTLMHQVRMGPREEPVNKDDYTQQWLPSSGAARSVCCPASRDKLSVPDGGNHCCM